MYYITISSGFNEDVGLSELGDAMLGMAAEGNRWNVGKEGANGYMKEIVTISPYDMVDAVLPEGCEGYEVQVTVFDHMMVIDAYWDGGSAGYVVTAQSE